MISFVYSDYSNRREHEMPNTIDISVSEANKMFTASPAGKIVNEEGLDCYEHGWVWQRYAYPNIRTVGRGPQPVNLHFIRCEKSGVCRTTNMEEYYEKKACKARDKQIKVVIWEQRRIEFLISADTDDDAESKARQIHQDYADGNLAYGDVEEVIEIDNQEVKAILSGTEAE